MKKKFADKRHFLITQIKRFDYGKDLIGRVLSPISFVIAFFTLLKVYNISLTFEFMAITITAAVVFMFFLGYVWDRLGFVEEEIEYGNERNRFVKAVLDKMDHKKGWMKLLKKSRIR